MSESFLHSLFYRYLHPIVPASVLKECLTGYYHRETSRFHPTFEGIVFRNQFYGGHFRDVGLERRSKSKMLDTEPDSEGAREIPMGNIIGLFKSAELRNIFLCIFLYRYYNVDARKVDNVFKAEPPKKLKYALEVEDYLLEKRLAHPGTAFAAGLFYDLMLALIEKNGALQKTIDAYFKELWKESVKIARLCEKMASFLAASPYAKYSFAIGLFINSGQLLMALGQPVAWAEWTDKKRKIWQKFAPEVLAQQERKTLGWTHAELASMLALHYKPMMPTENVLLHYMEPYLLRNDAPAFQMAVILNVARSMVSLVKSGKDYKKELLTKNQIQWLQAVRYKEEHLQRAVRETII